MMAIHNVANMFRVILGTEIGGVLLTLYEYALIDIVLSEFGMIAVILYTCLVNYTMIER